MEYIAHGESTFMPNATQSGSLSKKAVWTGRVLTGLIAAFLVFDGTIHLMKPAPVVEAFIRLGFPLSLAVPLGIIEIVCVLLYLVPRTSILGAILLTGYLGGAIATQLHSGSPVGELSFPILMGVIVWAGLYLRDDRLRSLIPLRS
jgi:DoxX-like protein